MKVSIGASPYQKLCSRCDSAVPSLRMHGEGISSPQDLAEYTSPETPATSHREVAATLRKTITW